MPAKKKHGGGGWCDMGLTNGSMKNLAEEEFSNMTGTLQQF